MSYSWYGLEIWVSTSTPVPRKATVQKLARLVESFMAQQEDGSTLRSLILLQARFESSRLLYESSSSLGVGQKA